VLAERASTSDFDNFNMGRFTVAQRPVWSPDGRLIAVSGYARSLEDVTSQVVVIDASSGAEVAVYPSETPLSGLAWLEDGVLVAIRGARGTPRQLWTLSHPGGRWARLTNDLNEYLGITLTADRNRLVTSRQSPAVGGRSSGIWLADGRGGRGQETAGGGGRLAWAGNALLYTELRQDVPEIVRHTAGGGAETILAGAAIQDVTHDGRIILFLEPGSSYTIWKLEEGGGARSTDAAGASAVITPDGRQVLYLSLAGGVQSPWMVPLDGGTPRQVTTAFAGFDSLAVSPDGQLLAFWSQDDRGQRVLRMCPIAACESTTILAAAPPSQGRLRFTPDGRAIAFIDPARTNLWLLPLDGGAPRQLTTFTDGRAIVDFAWSRDGTRLAVSLRANVANDIVMFSGLTQRATP
jgi:Tol biopolymer transport system component